MKRSIGFAARLARATFGSAGRFGGMKAQCFLDSALPTAPSGQSAPLIDPGSD